MSTKFDVFKILLSKRIVDEATLLLLGGLLGIPDYEIKGIKYNKDKDGIAIATREVIKKWQGTQLGDETELRNHLREAFKNPNIGLISDFNQIEKEIYGEAANGSGPPGGPTAQGKPANGSAAASPHDQRNTAQAHRGHVEVADFDVPEIPSRSRYPIKKYKRLGRAVIINNEFYNGSAREGTDIDERRIKEVVTDMGLELTPDSSDNPDGLAPPEMFVLKDQGLIEIRDTLEKVSKLDHSEYACFCCFVLSHGNDRCLRTVDGAVLTMKDLTDYFKGESCPSLIGKPKLFFIQACQGSGIDRGTRPEQADDDDDDDRNKSLPTEADIFVFYATPFGYKAWRHPDRGSRFIQCLCKVLEECYQNTDLLEMATIVNEMVSEIEAESGYKQVSLMTSTLRKQFFFKHQR